MKTTEYFQQHTLDPEFVKKTLGWNFDDSTITIPIYDENGKLLFCRYRHMVGEAKFSSDKGSYPVLYCLHKIKTANIVVLCEGEPDAARLWQEKITATTSAGVKNFSEEIAEPLRGKIVYVCLDNDKAGQESIFKYITVLEAVSAKPRIVTLPSQYKDVSEFFSDKETESTFTQFMQEAIPADEWMESHEPEDFKLETDEQLLSDPLPEESWIIDRVLPSEGFTFVVGAEATGKSFYTLSMAHSAVTGEPWLGTFPVKTTTKVLFIDKENTRRITQKRIRGLQYENHGDNVYRVRFPEKLQLTGEKGGFSDFALSLSRKVKKLGIGLIVVDSFADVMVGNENAASDVQAVFDAFRSLFPNKAILILHHENKPSQGVSRNSGQRVRGSSNINAQIVSGFRVEVVPKTKNEFTLEQIKVRDAEKLNKFKISMVIHPDPENAEKTIVTNLQYDGEVVEEKEKTEEAKSIIKESLSLQDSIPSKDLLASCEAEGISVRTFRRAIKEMKEAGSLKTTGKGKAAVYVLTGFDVVEEQELGLEETHDEIIIS